ADPRDASQRGGWSLSGLALSVRHADSRRRALSDTAGMSFDPSSAAVGGGIYGLPFSPEEARVVLLPVPWEATVSYGTGAAAGPQAILEASRQVDLRDRDTGRPYEAGIAMLPVSAEVRAWSDDA